MRVVDLTMRITPSIKVFPGSPQPHFIQWSTFGSDGYDSEAMFLSTHTGTHVDAPSHFVPDGDSIDSIPVNRLLCNGTLIKVRKRSNQLIEQKDLVNSDIREGDAVIIATGWERNVSKNNYMTENPGLSEQAAKYLAKKRINAVGIDGPSIDAGSNRRFVAHKILLSHDILAIENLCNVTKITKDRFTFVFSVLKLGGATGSPARVFTIL